ncbi:MAG: TrbI F-type domain-containing protein, partial [Candidatus Nitrosotenuis sp.]
NLIMSNYLKKLNSLFSLVPFVLSLISVSIILSLVIFTLAGNLSTKSTIATVDITGIVQQFVQSQAKLNLPKSELQKRVNTFGHQLETTLQTLSHEKHLIIMPEEAVLAGSIDLTSLVKQKLEFVEKAPSLNTR